MKTSIANLQHDHTISLGYTPRKLQAYLHTMVTRFAILVCHRRFGKTVWAVLHIIQKALSNDLENPVYAYIAPQYKQVKRIAWPYFLKYLKNVPYVTFYEQELRVKIERPHKGDYITIYCLGAADYDSLRGMYFDGVVLDEAAQIGKTAWAEVIRPALSDRFGWAVFIGTPKGRNFFHEMYLLAQRLKLNFIDGGNASGKEWSTFLAKASITKIIVDTELQALKDTMDPDEYNQEMECSFEAGMVGAYYAKMLHKAREDNRVCNVPYEPMLTVYTFWDLGMDDHTAIWFIQVLGNEFRVIDYYENNGQGLQFYAGILRERGYSYERHYFPHDMAVKELGTGVSRLETWVNLGFKNSETLPRMPIEDGINAVKMVLPRCWFDTNKTLKGFQALENYSRDFDEIDGVFAGKPKHDWTSHAADAFRQFGIMHLRLSTAGHWTKDKAQLDKYRLADHGFDSLG